MSRRPRGTRPAIVVATLLTAGLALGGCSAGSVTQTDTIVSQADGATGQVGGILLRDVSLDAGPTNTVPSGAEVPLRLTIINQTPTEDRLVSVTSPYAVSARPEGPTTIPANNSLRIIGNDPGTLGPADPFVRVGGSAAHRAHRPHAAVAPRADVRGHLHLREGRRRDRARHRRRRGRRRGLIRPSGPALSGVPPTVRTVPPRTRAPRFECTACGHASAKWVGRCSECGGWGTVEEAPNLPAAATGGGRTGVPPSPAARPSSPVRLISEVDLETATARPTGVGELDRVLGGGFVPGVVVLLAGEPGVGKSTLLLEVAARRARLGATVLYVTGEESAGQVRLRAERTGALAPHLFLSATADLEEVAAHVEAVDPELLVVDSVQTVGTATVDGTPGGVSQVRAVTSALVALAKQRDLPVVLIGHVTKDGAVAGPRTLEHLVDVVLSFEGERHSPLRLVRGMKNRFGATDEVGCFEMNDGGIAEVSDPSGLFTGGRVQTVAGQAVTVAMEGKRPLMAEVQALVATRSSESAPRRVVSDLDSGRVAEDPRGAAGALPPAPARQGRVRRHRRRPAAARARLGPGRSPSPSRRRSATRPSGPGSIAVGEVGLGGEVRRVVALERRLAEAGRLGISRALVPPGDVRSPKGLAAVEVDDLQGALLRVGLTTAQTV